MFKIGQKSSMEKTFSEEEVSLFSRLSKDANPIHFDQGYAQQSRFGQRIVQGPFVVSLIGGILGSELPGPGTIYINQNSNFLKPVFIGDTITAHVQIISIRADKPVIKLRTWIENTDGELVIDGDATVIFLDDGK
ncbi:MAG: MaoC family dehydratase [Sphingobacteriales bacterium]|nr:MAG: MaoC family dehydratase [Sphingobacteriales bacterium]